MKTLRDGWTGLDSALLLVLLEDLSRNSVHQGSHGTDQWTACMVSH